MDLVHSWGGAHPPSSLRRLSRDRDAHNLAGATGLYGNGRSYGDSCLNQRDGVFGCRELNRLVAFNPDNGVLTCEPGVLLRDIQQTFIPQGWALPVTPGTQLATIAGAVANDVHGKNHHSYGCIGNHVISAVLQRCDGTVLNISPNENDELFAATIGGLGLTGIIREVSIQLRPVSGPWLDLDSVPFDSLTDFFALSEASEDWEYTVAWLDGSKPSARCRGIFSRANHCDQQPNNEYRSNRLNFPFELPISAVHQWTMLPFNELYYRVNRAKSGRSVVHYEPFFYPLDSILNWNRVYGKRGFYQYQMVVPADDAQASIGALIDEIYKARQGSFLSVLKVFGDNPSPGLLSFPMPGATLAMDFPNKGKSTLKLFDRLDAIVRESGGRLYVAKDGRMSKEMFFAGYPNVERFMQYRDPGLSTDFSQRIFGD